MAGITISRVLSVVALMLILPVVAHAQVAGDSRKHVDAVSDRIYSDGISNIAFVGGMVRIDFYTLSLTNKDKNGRPTMEFLTQLVLPPDSFLQALDAMQTLVQQLKDQGVVRPPLTQGGKSTPEPKK